MNTDKALGQTEFGRLLNGLGHSGTYKPTRFAVAVSGGADSLALTCLAAQWATKRNIPMVAVTVDHGLRRGSGAEAKRVGLLLKTLGITHKILRWRGDKPSANIQALAREARYDLLLSWCQKTKTPDLLLAHHLDDQAETVLLRLIRGSGVDGLAAMSPVRQVKAVRLLRPLLSVPSMRLKATCVKLGLDWIEDPSNQNQGFARIKVRKLLEELDPAGLDTARLAQTASHMARARQALDWQTDAAVNDLVTLSEQGVLDLARPPLVELPTEIALRLLTRCLMTVGGGTYGPRFERLRRLYENVVGKSADCRLTLAGCQVVATSGQIKMFRENRNLPKIAIKSGSTFIWDNRYHVSLKVSGKIKKTNLRVGPLGAEGWKIICAGKHADNAKEKASNLALPARYTLPALWDGDRLLAQPWLDLGAESLGITFKAVFSCQNQLNHESFQVVSPAKDLIY